ncbi:uncharacterized protein LOC105778061 isoform X1 [Gossypium raimondii]|uniref:uncharacterized protein LOC105778061 isoform X1 n=1 Tax=Gossypium raimondii TaxID=29730 RepID=UPI00227A4B83|nr:uncharacterized protein LOC105778061 isoform X1 [Gossypium raimondii]
MEYVAKAITALKKGAYLLKYGRRGKPKFCPFRLSNVQSTSDGADSTLSNPLCEESAQNSSKYSNRQSIHPPPAFGSSPNLESLALEANKSKDQDGDSSLLDSSHLSRSALTDKVLSKFNFLTSEQCFTTIFS